MADNLDVSAGSGKTVRAVEKGGDLAQVIVPDWGGAGAESLTIPKFQVTIAAGDNAVEGTTTGAAIVSDSNGTIQQYLRGLVKMFADTTPSAVIGVGFSVTATLTVTNGVYTAGDVVGGLLTLSNVFSASGKHAIIDTVVLAGVAALEYELWLFNAPLASTYNDNDVFSPVVADTLKCVGVQPIVVANYKSPVSAFNVATIPNVGLNLRGASANLYAYMKAIATTSPGTTTLYLTVAGRQVD